MEQLVNNFSEKILFSLELMRILKNFHN